MVNLRLSFFEVFNSNFHSLKVQRHLSLKITICYGKTLFLCIPKYFEIQNSTFQEKANTKVYALEDSLGVCVSFPFNMRYSSVLTVTCPEVDRSTIQVEHTPNLPTNKTGQNGYYLTRNSYSHLMQIYFKNPQALFHITTLFHFAVS